MSRGRTGRASAIIRGLGALVLLIAVIGGGPVLLLTIAGSPLPHTLPTLDEVTTTLTRHDDGSVLFMGALRLITWLAWAGFTATVLTEGFAQVRGRQAVRLPALGPIQRLSARLVAAVVIALIPAAPAMTAAGSTAHAATHAPAAASTPAGLPHTLDTHPAADQPATAPADKPWHTRIVRKGDTLWGIARDEYGHGWRFPRIYAASRHLHQPAAIPQLTDPDEIYPGEHLHIPETGHPHARPRVTPPATGPSTAPSTAPPAQRPSSARPHHRKPAAPSTPTSTPSPHASSSISRGSDAVPPASTPHSGRPSSRSTSAPATPPSSSTPSPSPTASGAGAHQQPAPPRTPAGGPDTTQRPHAPASPDEGVSVAAVVGYSALAAAGVLALLGLKRIIQQRRRRPGQRIKLPARPMSDLELQMRATENPVGVDLLDRSLRTLSANLAAAEATVPELLAVRLTATGVELRLATPIQPVAPFHAIDDNPARWMCPADAQLLSEQDARQVTAPYPALVTVGLESDGTHVLIDLEAAGAVSLLGAGRDAEQVLRALAVELATSNWTDDVAICMVGFGAELPAALDTGRLRHVADLDAALLELETWAREVGALLANSDAAGLREARTRGIAADAWTPQIILSAQPITDDAQRRITALLTNEPRTSIAAVVGYQPPGTPLPGPWRLTLTGDAPVELELPELSVALQHITDRDYERLVGMLATANDTTAIDADTVDAEPPGTQPPMAQPSGGDSPPGADAAPRGDTAPQRSGHRRVTIAWPPAPTGPPGTGTDDADDATGEPDSNSAADAPPTDSPAPAAGSHAEDEGEGEKSAPTTAADAPSLLIRAGKEPGAGHAAEQDRGQDHGQDPSAPVQEAPKVLVLGAVEVINARGPAGERRASLTEIAAYLVLHPGCENHALTEAIWPGRRSDAQTRNSQISRLRRWLGADADGNPYMPLVTTAGYTLAPAVTCDWTRFQQLAQRGLAAGANGIADLQAALELVRGQPFSGVSPRRYAWAEYLRQEMISAIVDVAHAVAEQSGPDHQAAKNAASKGLLAAPESELLWCDLIMAEYQAGNYTGVESAIDRLTARNDELGVEHEAHTVEVLQYVLQASRRARALS